MPTVTFTYGGTKKVVDATTGDTILKIALDHGIPMEHACGGNGFCTTCMCQIQEGSESLAPRNDREENMGITSDPYRLGCQCRLGDGNIEVEVNE